MNKFVFKKVAELTTEKTELSEVKVDLALIQDLEKEYSFISKGLDKMVSDREKILQEIKKYRESSVDYENFVKLKQQYETMAKELGVDMDEKYAKLMVRLKEVFIDYQNLLGIR